MIGRRAEKPLSLPALIVAAVPQVLAVIDGTLCHLTRQGAPAGRYVPLATAVVEFRRGPMCIYVREHPHGFLPGISNLYSLDGNLRLLWIADWPNPDDPCTRILDVADSTLVAEAASGTIVRLDAHTGQLRGIERPMAAAG
jgi:hypothetical protein